MGSVGLIIGVAYPLVITECSGGRAATKIPRLPSLCLAWPFVEWIHHPGTVLTGAGRTDAIGGRAPARSARYEAENASNRSPEDGRITEARQWRDGPTQRERQRPRRGARHQGVRGAAGHRDAAGRAARRRECQRRPARQDPIARSADGAEEGRLLGAAADRPVW